MNDIGVPLGFRGRALVDPHVFTWELATEHPRQYQHLILCRYIATLFSGPKWGHLETRHANSND